MDTKMMIEILGYIGSFLVLVSFLMVSVVKLRIVNTIGGFIFMIYALIIHSYPTAIMNFCLVLINLHFLWKMNKIGKEYDLVKVDKSDAYLQYQLNKHKDDIQACFPGTDFDFPNMNVGYLICNQGAAVGITLGNENNGTLDLLLDYTTPEFRDFSIGKFLFSKLADENIKKVVYKGSIDKHIDYLNKMGFVKSDEGYVKEL